MPGILSQLGPEAMANLRKMAESFQAAAGSAGSLGPDGVPATAEDDDDDEVPELVEADAVGLNRSDSGGSLADNLAAHQEEPSKLSEVVC